MKDDEKILEQAIDAMKQEKVPSGPSGELTEATMRKLEQKSTDKRNIKRIFSLVAAKSFTKIAAAAVLLITIGYATGRFAAPKPPDVEELRAAIEPAIREQLLDEVNQNLRVGLAQSYLLMRDELTEQYKQDLNEAIVQTLTASGAATNQLLEELIESTATARAQDRQLFAAALGQVEQGRIQDTETLSRAFVSFAVQTEDELQRTREDIVRLLSYYPSDDSIGVDESTNSNNLN